MILIDNWQETIEVSEELLSLVRSIIDYALLEEQVKENYEVSLVFVDNKEIRRLNKEFREKDNETDVLSFPMLSYENGKIYKEMYGDKDFDASYFDDGKLVLGDIALSLEKAKVQALEYNHSFEREVCYLLIHSILHLLGYDHMIDEEKLVMRKKEEEILEKFSIKR